MQQIATLNQRSLSSFPDLFATLAIPAISDLEGTYHGRFVGPAWVRALAGPGLYLGGLPGWCGKWLDGAGQGTNLLCGGSQITRAVPIHLISRPSRIDGRPALTVVYPGASPWPLPLIRDELRSLDDRTLLGMTMLIRFGLHRFPFPFLLELVD